jgi:hypothetical protein
LVAEKVKGKRERESDVLNSVFLLFDFKLILWQLAGFFFFFVLAILMMKILNYDSMSLRPFY